MLRPVTIACVALLIVSVWSSRPASASDEDDCNWSNGQQLIKTDPSVVESACRRLAKKGEAWAQFNLGVIYDQALGVSPDYREAAKWYKRAAKKGNPQAQYNLGRLYANGRGMRVDFVEAYKWFQIAANNLPPGTDQDRALRNRDKVAAYMTQQQVQEASLLAGYFKPEP